MAALLLVFYLDGFAPRIGVNTDNVGIDRDQSSYQKMQVHFLDVGQGDAIYIRTPDDVDVLIDGGPDKSVLAELGDVMPFWDREIDIMILTHPHADHVTGLVEVLRRFDVKRVYYTGVLHTTPDYIAWLNEIQKQKLDLQIVDHVFDVALGEYATLQFLYPQKSLVNERVSELNNSSIINRLVFNETSFLFTGDLEVEGEHELLESNSHLTSNVLKMGHHGSSSSSSEEFISAVGPEMGMIQCGLDNAFGHPHGRVLSRLSRMNVKVYRTDLEGRISLVSNGKVIRRD